jgi:hypothetical protein
MAQTERPPRAAVCPNFLLGVCPYLWHLLCLGSQLPEQQSPGLAHELPEGIQAATLVSGVVFARAALAKLFVVAKAGIDTVMKQTKAVTEISLVMFAPC